jgi:hypothetical protein
MSMIARALVLVLLLPLFSACGGDAPPAADAPARGAEASPDPPAIGFGAPGLRIESPREPNVDSVVIPQTVATEADWVIAHERVLQGRELQLDLLPLGEIVATIGSTFVGTKYVPGTLEVEGPERLVVNLRELDCVTFVEHVLAISRLVLEAPDEVLHDEEAFRRLYAETLTRIRYRGGELNGYPDRLHYFSEWISDGERKGFVRDVTAGIGGIRLPGAVDFMSKNPDAYRQLAEPGNLEAIREIERRLSREERHYIPQEAIESLASEIRNGDIIAATSRVEGLDIAHTGIALWKDGKLHLLHAPLIGTAVEISERPLADRINLILGQNGIMVARPVEPEGVASAGDVPAGTSESSADRSGAR